jgi:hypothetical protein
MVVNYNGKTGGGGDGEFVITGSAPGGGGSVGLPAFKPGGPNDPKNGGDGYMNDPRDGWRGNGANAHLAPAGGSPGNTDMDPDIENEVAFFNAQSSAVDTAFGEDAHRRNPEGDLTAASDAPMASDGDRLPAQSESAVGTGEPTTSADQRDAAADPKNGSDSERSVRSSLSSFRSLATDYPLMIGGAAAFVLLALAFS